MLKMLIRMLILGLLLVLGLGRPINHSQAFSPKGHKRSLMVLAPVTVEVTFDGLMVFRRVGNHYEVGILDGQTAPEHEFKVTVGGKDISDRANKQLTSGNIWSLNVINSFEKKEAPSIKPRQVKGCNRLPDTKDEQVNLEHVFDFCWIMDLEKEFHGARRLSLMPGKLKPIIRLYNGELYTKYKYDLLERQPDWSPFGFVAETIALRVQLRAGEKLVLSSPGGEVFELTPDANSDHSAGIFNAPPPMAPDVTPAESHFRYYYDLFSNVNPGDKYDIRRSPTVTPPLNRYYPASDGDIRNRTFDHQACGGVFLGMSTEPLR
jgi:hypothetical protein